MMVCINYYNLENLVLSPIIKSRIIAAVSISFTSDTRVIYETLNAPIDYPFLFNMAVDPKFRR